MSTQSSSTAELRRELKSLIVEALRLEGQTPEDIADETLLWGDEGLGLDSIDALELVTALEGRYGLQIADDDMDPEQLATVARLADFIENRRSEAEGQQQEASAIPATESAS